MYLSIDKCEKCLNRTNCDYKAKYDNGVTALGEFMRGNNVDFYGTVRAHCDYFFRDESTDEHACQG